MRYVVWPMRSWIRAKCPARTLPLGSLTLFAIPHKHYRVGTFVDLGVSLVSGKQLAFYNQKWLKLKFKSKTNKLPLSPHTICMNTHAHTHAHAHTHIVKQSLRLPCLPSVPALWHLCATQVLWFSVGNSFCGRISNPQEAVPCLTGKGVGTRSTIWTFTHYVTCWTVDICLHCPHARRHTHARTHTCLGN